jgi:hypothetical protein
MPHVVQKTGFVVNTEQAHGQRRMTQGSGRHWRILP